jgi:divalent metal cation (Fe/Co/Zn/Cd) transporter
MYEGILHLIHPRPATHAWWTYAVLAGAFVFEGTSWTFAWRSFRRERGRRGIWEAIATSKDPSSFAVLFEDSAALLGLLVAFGGVWLSDRLASPIPDGVASLLIGAILMVTAALLVKATLRLLVGQSADPALVRAIRDEVGRDEVVKRVGRVVTLHFGPESVLAELEIAFVRRLQAEEVAAAIDRLQRGLKSAHPELSRVFIEAEHVADGAPEAGGSARG